MEPLYSKEGRFILAVFCMDYHSGQWSRGYRILCRLKVRNISKSDINESRETELYRFLEHKYQDRI